MIDWDSCVLWLDSKYFSESRWWDRSKYNNDGVVYGARFKEDGFYFDNNYLVINNHSSLNPREISIEIIMKATYFTGSGNNPIIDKPYTSHSNPYYQYHLGINGHGRPTKPGYYIFQLTINGSLKEIDSNGDTYDLNKDNHIVGTFNGNIMKLYRNKELINSLDVSGSITSYNTNIFIAKFGNLSQYTPCVVKLIRIFKKGLSEDEVEVLATMESF